jgi:hypothetical protein
MRREKETSIGMGLFIISVLAMLTLVHSAYAFIQFEFDQPVINEGFDFQCSYDISKNMFNITDLQVTIGLNSTQDYQCFPYLDLFYMYTNITPLTEPEVQLTQQEQEMADRGYEFHCTYKVEPNPYHIQGSTISAYFNSEDDYECPPILDLYFENTGSNYKTQEEKVETTQLSGTTTPSSSPNPSTTTPTTTNPASTQPLPTTQTAGTNTALYWIIGIVALVVIVAIILVLTRKK